MADHRASPGLPSDFMAKLGFPEYPLALEGQVVRAATLTCCHCGGVYVKNPDRVRDRGHCFKCDDYICDLCVGKDCSPFSRVLDDAEKQASRAQVYDITTRFNLNLI